MKNKVVAGDFQNWDIICRGNRLYFMHRLTKEEITKNDIARFETVSDVSEHSLWKPLLAGGIGSAMFGLPGMMIGAAAASGGRGSKSFLVSLEFIDGRKSLLEVDKAIYKILFRIFGI
ncbi:MAG: hypothetical protein IJC99_01250 [Clostridia bacterium]|nr:hypothetical protein [Clostridia bacterium]